MGFRNLVEKLKNETQSRVYETADTINHEGHPAWKLKGWDAVRQVLYTGVIGNTFYVDEDLLINYYTNTINDFVSSLSNPEDVIKFKNLIVDARRNGFFRTIPLYAMAILRAHGHSIDDIFDKVAITPQDATDFMTLNRAIGKGFGRNVKKALIKWLMKHANNSFYAVKYRKHIADIIRIARPRIPTNSVFPYVYAYYKNVDYSNVLERYEQIAYAEKLKKLASSPEFFIDKAIEYIEKGRLPADLVIGILGHIKDSELWLAIAKQMGVMQFVNYSSKLLRTVGDTEELLSLAKQKVTPENLNKARVFPMKIFLANAHIPSHTKLHEYYRQVASDYVKFYDKKWPGRWLIAPDVSASMTWSVIGGSRPADIAGAFAAVIYGGLTPDAVLLPWDDRIRDDVAQRASRRDPWLTYEAIANANGGGTYMELPVKWALEKNEKFDYFLFVTDGQEWGEGFYRVWHEYRKKINPNAKAILIVAVPYGMTVSDPEKREEDGIYEVYGWSDSVIKWIEWKVLS